MGYQKSTLECSLRVRLHMLSKKSKSRVEEDVSDPTMFDLSETFMCGSDFGKPPELTSPLRTPNVF